MNRAQGGFTLLELVIAFGIFALLGVACWRLFDGVVRAERSSAAHEYELRSLQRAVALIERDVLQVQTSVKIPGVMLYPEQLNLRRGNWRNPLSQPRSELQDISYQLKNGELWRYSRGLDDGAQLQQHKLLSDVRHVSWRLYERKTGWRGEGQTGKTVPQALELQMSVGRFEGIRRVWLLPEGE